MVQFGSRVDGQPLFVRFMKIREESEWNRKKLVRVKPQQVKFNLGELFCGPGGIGLGALRAKIKTKQSAYSVAHVWASDHDKDACATYKKNIPVTNVFCQKIEDLDFSKLPQINALAFGFPCNDFSVVGEKKGIDGAYGPLYSYGVKALRHFKPKWFLAENVGGLKNANEGTTLNKILEELEGAGYSLYPHLYKFEEYGIPQSRHRIIIIGIRKDIPIEFGVPAPSIKYVSCREALENPPIPKNAANHELTLQSPIVIERLKHIKSGENAFTALLPDHLKLNVKTAKISQIYKRLNPNKPAYTITGSGGGGTHVYHWSENRALTNRERARLQTFPDNFIFCGSKESVRKQIGMAVPPKGAQIIFESILKSFAGVQYPSVKPNMLPQKSRGEILAELT